MVLEIDGQPRHITVNSVFRFHPNEAEACVRFVNAIRRAGMIIPSQQVIHNQVGQMKSAEGRRNLPPALDE